MGLDALLENQLGHLPKFHINPFLPQGSKLSLFLPWERRFLRYGLILKIAIFRHETWPLAKVPEVAHTLFLPHGVKIELNFALQVAVSEI